MAEAEPLQRELFETYLRLRGEDDAETTWEMFRLARLLQRLDKLAEAAGLDKERIEILWSENPLRMLPSMVVLANLRCDLNEHLEAERLFKQTMEVSGRLLPKGDPKRERYPISYGLYLTKVERYDEAEPQLLGAYKALRDGPGNYFTQIAIKGLVDLYTAWDKPDKAAEYRALLTPPEK